MRSIIFHNILLIFIWVCITLQVGCTPVKRTASTQIKEKADYSEITNELKTQRTQLDKVTETMNKTKEQIAEWLNENIDYEEQKYDSLGRLISTIKQTTSRNGGTNVVKQGDTYVYEGVTVQQVDSIVSAQMKQLRAELTAKSTEKKEGGGILRYIMIFIGVAVGLIVIVSAMRTVWEKLKRPNLLRKFGKWIKRLFCRR